LRLTVAVCRCFAAAHSALWQAHAANSSRASFHWLLAARPLATVWTGVPHICASFGRRRYYLFCHRSKEVYLMMTDKIFKQILLNLNKGVAMNDLVVSHLIHNVYYGIYWKYSSVQLKNHSQLFPKKLYIIKSDSDCWASVVYAASNDLHWYTTKKFRGKSILSQALRTYILPHIYQEDKVKKIEVTIDPFIAEYTASKSLALKLGFKPKGVRNGAELYYKNRPKNLTKIPPINDKVLLQNAIEVSRIILNYAHLLTTHCQVSALANDAQKVLLPLESKLSTLKHCIEDLLWDEEQKIQQS
jgi:hypothetical protein